MHSFSGLSPTVPLTRDWATETDAFRTRVELGLYRTCANMKKMGFGDKVLFRDGTCEKSLFDVENMSWGIR